MNNYQVALEAVQNMLDKDMAVLEVFNKKTYKSNFEKLYQKYVPAFDAIEELYHTVREPDEMLSSLAGALTEQAAADIKAISRRNTRDAALMNFNMQLAVFVFPAILHYKGDSSKPFTEAIGKKWKEAFPKTNVQAAEMEYIEKGFHRKWCYITTAVCETQGKPDDCYELTLLRDYRDGYLLSQENGEELIRRYYDVAPSIVRHIGEQEDSDEIYGRIWDKYLSPCIHLIECGKNEECRLLYTEMVEDLQNRYFLR